MTDASRAEQLLAEFERTRVLEAEPHLQKVIELDGVAARYAYYDHIVHQSSTVNGSLRELDRRSEEQRAELVRAEAELSQLPEAGAVAALIKLAAAVVCLYSEYALTLTSLPFALSIARGRLAIAVSIAPVAAAVALDLVYERLFEGPYRARKSMAPRRRALVTSSNVLMLVMLAGLIAFTVFAISVLREQALDQLRTPDSSGAGQLPGLGRAVMALALMVTVGGAVLLAHGMADLRALVARTRTRRAVAQLREDIAQTDQTLITTRARADELHVAASQLEHRGALEEQRCAAVLRARLAAALGELPVEDLIQRSLRSRLEHAERQRSRTLDRDLMARGHDGGARARADGLGVRR